MISIFAMARTPSEIIEQYNQIAYTNYTQKSEFKAQVTSQEWKDVMDFAIEVSKTNRANATALVYHPFDIPNILCSYANGISLQDEYDEKLSNAGFVDDWLARYPKLPKLHEVYFQSETGAIPASQRRLFITLMKKYNTGSNLHTIAQFPEYVNAELEPFAYGGFPDSDNLENAKRKIVAQLPRNLRRAMRNKDVSFVATDKGNPLQDEIDAFTNALNAPKFAGLKEWFAKWFPEYTWIDYNWDTDENIQKLKDDVFYGDIQFSDNVKRKLQSHLGVEAYNAFVKQYNGTVD